MFQGTVQKLALQQFRLFWREQYQGLTNFRMAELTELFDTANWSSEGLRPLTLSAWHVKSSGSISRSHLIQLASSLATGIENWRL